MSMEVSLAFVFTIGLIVGFVVGCIWTESRIK